MRSMTSLIMLILLIPNPGRAANQTPGSLTAVLYQPYAFQLGKRDTCYDALSDQGYSVNPYGNETAGITPSGTLTEFAAELAAGNGVFVVHSHGTEQGLDVEVYERTQDGEDARDAAFSAYLAEGWVE